MNPLRMLLNKYKFTGILYYLTIYVDQHGDEFATYVGNEINEINPNGFTTLESEFEIPYHRVRKITAGENLIYESNKL